MSNRALRKIHGSNVLDSLKQNLSSESEEDPVLSVAKPSSKKKPAINSFALLNEQEESDSNVSPVPEEKADACKDSTSHAGQITDSDVANQTSGVKPKRKKNKKKKKATDAKGDQTFAPNNELDEVENSVREVNALLGELPNRNELGSSSRVTANNRDLLTIERKHLCPENELKKIFGSRVVQAELRKKGRGRLPMKSTWLVTPSPHWAQLGKVTGGLTMNLLESTGQTSIFAYEHNKDYQKIQMQFLQAVESLNPENIAAVVNAHPHHIDSLLQLSDICRMGEDIQTATELIERALYCLELAFHPSFNVAQGKCRLEYRRQENRALFLALFKHLTYIGQKGCYRTALEFCKLLYNLDPEADPLAVQLMIDFYAVRAQEQDWLIRFYHQFESVKNFSQLPNMAYSIAAAYFGKHRTERDPSDLEKANQYLQEALIMFPGVLQPLLDKCSIQADPRVAKHEFFGIKAMSTQTPALEQLIQLYVGRSYHVWKEPDLLPWLEQNAHAVLERVDDKDPHVVDCEEKRKKRYQGMPRNIYRHIIMSEIKDATATLPPNLAEGPLMTFDPLPPADSINSYSVTRTASTTQENDGSLLSVFLRSLMPGYNVVEPRGAAGVGGAQGHLDAAPAAEEVQEAPNEFRNATMDVSRTVSSLMEAARMQLLQGQLVAAAAVARFHEAQDEFRNVAVDLRGALNSLVETFGLARPQEHLAAAPAAEEVQEVEEQFRNAAAYLRRTRISFEEAAGVAEPQGHSAAAPAAEEGQDARAGFRNATAGLRQAVNSLVETYGAAEPQGHLAAAPAAEEVQEARAEFPNATADLRRTVTSLVEAADLAEAQGYLAAAPALVLEAPAEFQNVVTDFRRVVISLADYLRDNLGRTHLAEVEASDEAEAEASDEADSDDSED